MAHSLTRTVILVGTASENLILSVRLNPIPTSQSDFAAIPESLVTTDRKLQIPISHIPSAFGTTAEEAVEELISQIEEFFRIERAN
jgi:hypothetical protein